MTTRNAFAGFLLASSFAFAACGNPPQAPSPIPQSPPGPSSPPTLVGVRIDGRVIDIERGMPVPGASVKTGSFSPGAGYQFSATSDAEGRFSLAVDLPAGWKELDLHVSRDGYEGISVRVGSDAVSAVELRMLPILTIRSGESREAHVFLGTPITCFIESALCRRVVVDSPSGEPIRLEVFAVDETQKVGLTGPLSTQPYSIDEVGRRVTVSGGEVWIVPMSATPTGVRGVFEQKVILKASSGDEANR